MWGRSGNRSFYHDGTLPSEYQTKVFGGGNMFSKITDTQPCTQKHGKCLESLSCKKVSCKNASIGPYLLQKNGFTITNHDLGGTQHRKVIFDVWSGDVWLRRGN
ncbi:hypothetical protein [Psychromonas antarctica]|uniref:hypothetical protein n=1 Tax=Psychromonas antarctica TaxID=67573 RepID=UPI003B83A027